MRPTRHQWAMTLAAETARRSTCLRRAVGCVLLDRRGKVLATGYNGVASGMPHCNEGQDLRAFAEFRVPVPKNYPYACRGAFLQSGQGLDLCEAVHAEANALLQCRDVQQIAACYCTASPCVSCAKLLLNTSAEEVYFRDEYPHPEARELWERAGRVWVKMEGGC